MHNQSKFDFIDGKPDEEQVQNWVDEFFYNLMNILNTFYATVELEEVAERMSCVPFDKLILEQIEDEGDEVKKIAVSRITELAAIEIEYVQHYSKRD